MYKIISFIGLFVVLFTGCTVKNSSSINPYIIQHHQVDKKHIKIDLVQINDERSSKMVSTIYSSNKIKKQFPIDVNLIKWYQEAFTRELTQLDLLDKNSPVKLTVNIKQFTARFDKYSAKKDNLKAKLRLELILKKGDTTSTMQINLNQTMYKVMILDAQGFENILNSILSTSVSKSVKTVLLKL